MIRAADLRGLWGFPLTPFRDDRFDAATYPALVRSLVDGGADVVIAAGTLGQGDRMSEDERAACLASAVLEIDGAVPVLGVIAQADGRAHNVEADADHAAESAVAARRGGADGVLLLPATGRVEDVARGLAAIGVATDGELPVVVYQRGALRIEPSDLRELARDPTLIGLKDALGDLRHFRRQVDAVGSRLAWVCASEDLAAAYCTHGADAVAPASMAYAPAYARRWWRAIADGDIAEAVGSLRRFAWPMTELRYSRPHIEVTAVNEMARLFGQPVGDLRPPAEPLQRDEVDELLRLADILRSELDGISSD